ncbi:MAG: family 10 glycosylhydrolase [Cyanobacteria bacterium J06626_6]
MPKSEPNPKRQKRWIRGLLFFGSLWLVLMLWQAPLISPVRTNQIRGVWMTNLGASISYYTMRTDEVVANLARHRLNTLYPCVWNRGYTLHHSEVAAAAGGMRKDVLTDFPLWPFDDALGGFVRQAHRQKMRILPWFEYGLMIPESSAIARTHPEWLTVNLAGNRISNSAKPNSFLPKPLQNFQLEAAGGNLAWLNPFLPEVQQFLTDLIIEVVARYPVDGIQLDDHFGLPVAFGYDAYTIDLYKQEHNNLAPPENKNDPEWVAWRADKITQLLQKITLAVKQANPDAIVSVSPNPPRFAYQKYLQDWRRWVDETLVDEVVVQVYRDDLSILENDLYNSGFYDVREQVPTAIGLYTGPLLAAKSIERLDKEIASVQAADYGGVSFFCWETTLWAFQGSPAHRIRQTLVNRFGFS